MSETRITDNREQVLEDMLRSANGTDVIYKMSPFIADELAEVLTHAAVHNVDGSLRKPENYDQGWLRDAEALRNAALGITTRNDDGN